MKLLTEAKLKLAKMLKLTLGSVSSNKGNLYFDGDIFDVGTEMFAMNEEGDYILPDDGDYEVGNQILTLANGIVTDIKESGSVSDEPGNMQEEVETVSEDTEVSADEFNTLATAVNTMVSVLEEIQSDMADFKAQKQSFEAIKTELEAVKLKLAKVSNESNGDPVPPSNNGGARSNDATDRFFNAGRGK